ncbi:hypothetical protein L9F63_004646 [Diploptera punctata]|uniref:Glucosidase II subunit alpha n=1 Tax=Diploptera punctata TaxID=6984 RepID=A0AAD7ZG52_DIPPU|nr:hypothetical protein L9F63_004646 [Diploptera punctata]
MQGKAIAPSVTFLQGITRLPVLLFLIVELLTVQRSTAVDRNNFKSCQQSSFCRRCRGVQSGESSYELHLNTLKVEPSNIQADIVNTQNDARFHFQLFALQDGTFRMKINEKSPLKPRFEVPFALIGEPALDKLEVVERNTEFITIKCGENKIIVNSIPFSVNVYSDDELVISANARGLMRFEHMRHKPEQLIMTAFTIQYLHIVFFFRHEGEAAGEGEGEGGAAVDDTVSDPGAWEENFKSHHDTKPNGPTAVAMDFSFPGAYHAYGIPEHADSFALKSTKNSDPYRLYNLDVFEYELHNGMALYGSIPVLIAHGTKRTVGVFWMNAAETWVDIFGPGDQNVVSSIVNFVSGSAPPPQVDSHFMSESGIIDTFFMVGPKPKDVFRQYTKLTGTAPLPQYFALAHHQSRWNYNDQDDVRNVDNKFDEYDIPNDVMWLDIEHTDGKKYFTWDPIKFSQSVDMVNNLTAKGRKLVAIVDPHIKRDAGYFLHNDAENNDYYVKTKDGKVFEGWCWPGSSSYLDLMNPEVRNYLSSRYLLENYHGSTLDLYIWNDMNEPSVFNGPEVTMHKDCVHHGDWEHRDIHNIYGLIHTLTTFEGLMKRGEKVNCDLSF